MKRILIFLLMLSTPAEASLAVKNFRQIFESLVVSTGVSPTDSEISAYYAQSYTRLPMTGSVNEVSSPGLLTFTALSGLFCKKLVAADSKLLPSQRRAHQAVDFAKPPSGLSAQVQQSVIENYFGIFLSRSPGVAELQILKEGFNEAAQGLGATAADTQLALMLVCASVASSLDSLIL